MARRSTSSALLRCALACCHVLSARMNAIPIRRRTTRALASRTLVTSARRFHARRMARSRGCSSVRILATSRVSTRRSAQERKARASCCDAIEATAACSVPSAALRAAAFVAQ